MVTCKLSYVTNDHEAFGVTIFDITVRHLYAFHVTCKEQHMLIWLHGRPCWRPHQLRREFYAHVLPQRLSRFLGSCSRSYLAFWDEGRSSSLRDRGFKISGKFFFSPYWKMWNFSKKIIKRKFSIILIETTPKSSYIVVFYITTKKYGTLYRD